MQPGQGRPGACLGLSISSQKIDAINAQKQDAFTESLSYIPAHPGNAPKSVLCSELCADRWADPAHFRAWTVYLDQSAQARCLHLHLLRIIPAGRRSELHKLRCGVTAATPCAFQRRAQHQGARRYGGAVVSWRVSRASLLCGGAASAWTAVSCVLYRRFLLVDVPGLQRKDGNRRPLGRRLSHPALGF